MKMEHTECSKMSAHEIQMPGNHPKEKYNIQNTAKVWNREMCIGNVWYWSLCNNVHNIFQIRNMKSMLNIY